MSSWSLHDDRGVTMSESKEFRARAREYEALAQHSQSELIRKKLLRLMAEWDKLADEAELADSICATERRPSVPVGAWLRKRLTD